MATFEARYAGRCVACQQGIEPGDDVTHDGADGLVHAVCPEEVLVRHGEPCSRCFIELPLTGVCPTCE